MLNKFRVLFIILFFLSTVFGFAQKRATLGIKGGYGFSSYFFVTDDNINTDRVTSDFMPVYNTGITFSYLDKIMGIRLGAQYAQKGWKETFNNGSSAEVIFDYWEFPLLTNVRFGKNKKSGWVLILGVYGAFVIETNEITSEPELDYSQDTRFIEYGELKYNNFEYGIKAGGGYELGIGKNSLQLEIMLTQGMANLFEADRLSLYRSLSQSLTINVIYNFTLFKSSE